MLVSRMHALPLACNPFAMRPEAFAAHMAEGDALSLSLERTELDEAWSLRLPDDDRTAMDCARWIGD